MSLQLPETIPARELPENNPPMRLSFCIPRRVLHGGMSLVYLCDTTSDEAWQAPSVAIKRLAAETLAFPGAAERFLRECYFWLQISEHPNVVSALSAHQAQLETPLLALEYVPNSLRQTLSERMDFSVAVRTLIGIGDGLAHARSAIPGFIHADLKPENVLVSGDGTAKITDLGLSRVVPHLATSVESVRAASAEEQASLGGSTSLAIVGTPEYMAPEQILGAAVPETDVYAIGCIAYELFTGAPAYGTDVPPANYLLRHLHAKPAPLAGKRSRIPSDLRDLMQAMLAKSPAERPELSHVLTVLRKIAMDRKRPVPVPPSNPPDRNRQRAAAQGLVNLGLFQDALEMAEHSISGVSAEDAVHGRLIMAQSHSNLGRPDLADQQLDLVAEVFDADTSPVFRGGYHTERGRAASIRGDFESAVTHTRLSIEALPSYSRGYANAAVLYEQLGRRPEAIDMLFAALAIAGDYVYFNTLVNLLREEGRWDEALAVCDRAVEFHPTVAQAYILRAMTHILSASATRLAAPGLRELLIADLDSAQRYGSVTPEALDLWLDVIRKLSARDTRDHRPETS